MPWRSSISPDSHWDLPVKRDSHQLVTAKIAETPSKAALREASSSKSARTTSTPAAASFLALSLSGLRVTALGESGREAPHMDYKAIVDDRIRAELPELAAKTTYLYFGYYPQNMAFFPLLKPFELVSSVSNCG